MDAAKGQYINFMPEVLRLLKPGGILISDNVLQDGDIIEIDIPGEKISVRLTDEELAKRAKTLSAHPSRYTSGYLAKYAKLATSADKGAVLKWD